MAVAESDYIALVPYGPVKDAIRALFTQVTQMFAVQHNADGTHGAITATSIATHGRATAAGVWTTATYLAADFTGNGAQTWTVDAADAANIYYTVIGNLMTVCFAITATTVGGVADTQLRYVIPGGYIPASSKVFASAITIFDNGVFTAGRAQINGPTTMILFLRGDEGVFTAAANATRIFGQITFEVQ